VVLASGAHERAIAYENNDLPGTLLAGAVRTYYQPLTEFGPAHARRVYQ
jgi:sarcosine oxidase subunit alpha